MHILRVEIVGFGAYRNRQFVFEEGNQLVYGINEAGKSTLYQFIQTMFFGFPTKSKKRRDFTPNDGASYGGRLWFQTKEVPEVKIERFRQINNGRARVFVGENEVSEERLPELLNGLNQAMFQEIYTFQQEQLSQIDKLQEEELQEALLSLGISGSQQLLELTRLDRKKNAQVFSPQAKIRPLNQKITLLDSLQNQINAKEAQESEVQLNYQKKTMYSEKIAQANEQLAKISQEERLLHQQESYWEEYEEWQYLQRTVTNSMQISQAEIKEMTQFYERFQFNQEQIQKKRSEMARLEEGTDSNRYYFYLDHEADIRCLENQQIEIIRMSEQMAALDKEEKEYDASRFVYEKRWGWTSQNKPSSIDPIVFEKIHQLIELEDSVAKDNEKRTLLEKRQKELEWDIAQIERQDTYQGSRLRKKNPMMLKKQAFIGVGCFILGSFLSMQLFFIGLSFVVIGSCISLYSMYQYKLAKTQMPLIDSKEYWKEKYSQLDECLAKQQEIQRESLENQRMVQQLRNQLQPMFGQETNPEKWIDSLSIFESEAKQYSQLLDALETVKNQQKEQKHRVEELRPLIERFSEWVAFANLSITEQVKKILIFGEEMHTLKMERLQQPSTILAREIKQLQEEKEEFVSNAHSLLRKFSVERPSDLPVYLKQWQENQQKQSRENELMNRLSKIFPKTITYEEFVTKKKKLQEKRVGLEKQREEDSKRKQRIQVELEQMQQDGTLDDLYQARTQLEDEIRTLTVEWAANEIHANMLIELAENRTESQLPHLLERASEYLSILTNDHYQKIVLEESLIKVNDQFETIDMYQLSTGTKDQLVMAVRLAYISLNEQAALCPVIVDDGWLHYDHKRKYQLAKLFAEFGKKNQVICLSSDRDMVSYYKEYRQAMIELN